MRKILKKAFYLCSAGILFLPLLSSADPIPCESHQVTLEPGITYEQWDMPNHTRSMGVLGLHGLVDFNDFFYGGVGLYSAAAGESGGYFGLALQGGVQRHLMSKIVMDAGLELGGGGGHHTPVGGGLFYEPYLGLTYQFSHFNAGIYYSYVDFVDGSIASDQVGLTLSTPLIFNYWTGPSSACHALFCKAFLDAENYIAALGKVYFLNKNTTNLSNVVMNSPIEFLGVEFGHYVTQKIFLLFNFSGAFHGNMNGYADELLGIGYRMPLFDDAWSGILKLAAGSGGGGNVNTGGGFIYNPMLGIEYRATPSFGLELDGGYIAAPEGNFKATEANLSLKYYFSHDHDGSQSRLHAWRIRLLNQTYFKPRTNDGVYNPTMQLLGLNFDYFISHYFYLTGQTAFAYVGKNTGGYFSGLMGIGGETPTLGETQVSLFSELLAGTAGGAGLSIGDGALVEPVLGLQYQLNHAIALQTSVGSLIAVKGQFHPTTLMVGMNYKLYQ